MGKREQDLKEGEEKEMEFVSLLKKRNPDGIVVKSEGYFTGYDISLLKHDGQRILFEVKYDRLSSSTGNIAIERKYEGKPSGIFNSNADFIIYYFDRAFRCIEKQALISRLKGYPIVEGGDNKACQLTLIPKEQFKSFCTKIDDSSDMN